MCTLFPAPVPFTPPILVLFPILIRGNYKYMYTVLAGCQGLYLLFCFYTYALELTPGKDS